MFSLGRRGHNDYHHHGVLHLIVHRMAICDHQAPAFAVFCDFLWRLRAWFSHLTGSCRAQEVLNPCSFDRGAIGGELRYLVDSDGNPDFYDQACSFKSQLRIHQNILLNK